MADDVKPATDEEIDRWRVRSSVFHYTEETVLALIARIDAEKARADEAMAYGFRLRDLFSEISGAIADDERMSYVNVQIGREAWDEIREVVGK